MKISLEKIVNNYFVGKSIKNKGVVDKVSINSNGEFIFYYVDDVFSIINFHHLIEILPKESKKKTWVIEGIEYFSFQEAMVAIERIESGGFR